MAFSYVSLLLPVLVLSSAHALATEDLLSQLSARSAQVQSVSGSFRQQRNIQQLPVALHSNGAFEYSAAKGVEWRTLHPVETILSVSEQGLRIDDGVQESDSSLFARLILKVFLGDVHALKQHFKIDAQGSLREWRIKLRPANEAVATQYKDIELSGAEFTQVLVLNTPGGDSTKIEFYDVTVSTLADAISN